MEPLNLSLDPAWGAGLLLAVTRVASFTVASPLLGRAIPLPGRLTFALALGLFLAGPVPGPLTVELLLGLGVANAVVGAALGFLTGLLFHMFAAAGGLIDLTSGLSVASVVDPTRGEHGSVFSRLFNLTGVALFYVAGGLELLVSGLALSVEAVPLAAAAAPEAGALAGVATRGVGRLLLAATELALPVLGALFLTELVLGLAARFAPQANVFLLGLPAKIFLTLMLASVAMLLFPEAMAGFQRLAHDAFVDVLRAF